MSNGYESLRKNMLARMLLHVIEAAVPVNAPRSPAAWNRAVQDMEDRPGVILLNVEDTGLLQRSGIAGLASGFGIKSRLIEDDRGISIQPALFDDVP
jgi:hypothetical protein